jgi:heme-degrading monooxygenase HmoA
MTQIMRKWTGRIRTADREDYVRYIVNTGLADYGATPGNLGYEMLMRDLPDGSSEVTTTSWWQDLASIAAFAGDPIDRARYYPEDDRFLLDRPETVEHHEVVAGARGA